MSFFDKWLSDFQNTLKTMNDATNWQPIEAMSSFATSEVKVAEKFVQQQNQFFTENTEALSKHWAALIGKTDPVAAFEANYSFFCEWQVKANSQYLATLDTLTEAKELIDQHLPKVFAR
ncbi:Phasin protein [Oceanospirillum multiglobuliferum]|uniref:Phasin domain-containing protein n=1 Tax=Oceanospirillum multiglobuliferum TaxID=64969 RepID=A0A1T4Q0I9_9GAMM|nr:hypothetical protein [Oceanospirillum multiglobuliferum]OPX55460.1 hypothetical protein BTE48_08715 [Oceanospirillum multiglobuliferum]SJZ97305.1 Phasin protein [Oceanospirillum multiglobuliferum]